MRTFVTAVAVLFGLMLAAVAIPAMWVDRNIVEEDGFVALAAPLGKDPVFQQRLSAAAVGSLGSDGRIPESLTEIVRPVLETAAASLTSLPGYAAAWEETLRKSHRLSFADPGSLPAGVGASTSLTLDVAPLVALVTQQISDAVRLPLEAPDQTLINIGQSSQRQLIERVNAYAPMGYGLALGSAVSLVLAFVAARRRWAVLAGVGAGALLLAGAWFLGSRAAGAAVSGTASGNAVAEIFKREFVAASLAGFEAWILVSLITGGVLLASGILFRMTAGRTRQ